jgi:sec-independent protein translocase protein TatA
MGISMTQLLVIAVIVLLLFGTKRLRNIGSDLGASIKGFKKAMNDGEQEAKQPDQQQTPPQVTQQQQPGSRVIDQAPQKQDSDKA